MRSNHFGAAPQPPFAAQLQIPEPKHRAQCLTPQPFTFLQNLKETTQGTNWLERPNTRCLGQDLDWEHRYPDCKFQNYRSDTAQDNRDHESFDLNPFLCDIAVVQSGIQLTTFPDVLLSQRTRDPVDMTAHEQAVVKVIPPPQHLRYQIQNSVS